jgi:hypothetical protein
MIYTFITPSDPITFKAGSNKVAFLCAALLGNGKAGCENTETNERIPSMLLFDPDPEKTITDYLGTSINEFLESNLKEVCDAFESFSYGSPSDRETYDSAVEAITDQVKLKEFKAKHEDKNRSSMSQWVNGAWKYGERLRSQTS